MVDRVNGDGLGYLRAAALQSKKRKRERAEPDTELEEGEISDDGPAPYTPATAAKPAGLYNPLGVVPTGPRKFPDKPSKPIEKPLPVGPAPAPAPVGSKANRPSPLPPSPQPPPSAARQGPPVLFTGACPVHFIENRSISRTVQLPLREPCRDLIRELVSWGVTPEYLVGYGLAKETIALAFVELGYRLPHNLAYLAEPAAQALRQAQSIHPTPTPNPVARHHPAAHENQVIDLNVMNGPPVRQPALAEMEKHHREELAARRSKRVAVEASIDSLFASAVENAGSAQSILIEEEVMEEGDIDDEEEGHEEAAEDSQPGADWLRKARTINNDADSAISSQFSPSAPLIRPRALDFESNDVHTRPIRNGFVPPVSLSQPQQLLLDLSDEDPDEDDAMVTVVSAAATSAAPEGQASRLASPDARKKLLDKEAEIKRMTARIQRLERKNRKVKAPTDGRSGAASPSTPLPTLPEAQLQQARDKMEQLVDERQEIIDAAVADEGSAMVAMQIDERSQPDKDEDAIPGYQAVHFTDYSSAFRHYSESRSIPPPPVFVSARIALLAFVANHRDIEAKRKICHFESEGGVCNDPQCKNVHFGSFEPQEGDVSRWLKAVFQLPSTAAKERIEVFQRGLDVLLGRFLAPLPTLDLDSLFRETHVFAKQLRPAV